MSSVPFLLHSGWNTLVFLFIFCNCIEKHSRLLFSIKEHPGKKTKLTLTALNVYTVVYVSAFHQVPRSASYTSFTYVCNVYIKLWGAAAQKPVFCPRPLETRQPVITRSQDNQRQEHSVTDVYLEECRFLVLFLSKGSLRRKTAVLNWGPVSLH